jgi:hypothetical protein
MTSDIVPSRVLLIANKNNVFSKNGKTYYNNQVAYANNVRFINSCRRNIGAKKISETLYAPEIEIEVDNYFTDMQIIDIDYTRTGYSYWVCINESFKGKIVNGDMNDLIRNGHIQDGYIKSPMKFIQYGSQISLRRIE